MNPKWINPERFNPKVWLVRRHKPCSRMRLTPIVAFRRGYRHSWPGGVCPPRKWAQALPLESVEFPILERRACPRM